MENCTYFFVEHDITDKQGWDGWMSSWFDICGESMIIRNVENEKYRLILPSTEAFDIPYFITNRRRGHDGGQGTLIPRVGGKECVLTIPTSDGMMTICLWSNFQR